LPVVCNSNEGNAGYSQVVYYMLAYWSNEKLYSRFEKAVFAGITNQY